MCVGHAEITVIPLSFTFTLHRASVPHNLRI